METNKDILQSHNMIITDNENIIDEILELVNEIPEAVEPTLQEKTVTPSITDQIIEPDSGYDGLSQVTINAVTSSIDSDIKAINIRKGIDILGVTGTMEEYVAPSLQSKTVSPSTSSQTIKPDSGYDGLSQVTVNAMTTATQATPSITVSSSGLITASATQTAGYVSAGTKSATKQLTTKGATTWTPKTSNQTISSGTYLTGTQTIKGDSNLIASNIKSGVSIFGVTGTLSGGITPTGTKEITENGIYDVTNYASASVNVSGGGSGGNIQTATITFHNNVTTNWSDKYVYTFFLTYINGEIVRGERWLKSFDFVLNNVVVGSDIIIWETTATANFNITSDETNATTTQIVGFGGASYLKQIKVSGDETIFVNSI